MSTDTSTTDGNCPACELSGITSEEARRRYPTYMAVLDALPPRDYAIPDEPADECWDCRQLRREGQDPVALIAADTRADGLPLHIARATAEHVVRSHGAQLATTDVPWRYCTRHLVTAAVATEIMATLGAVHGFGVEAPGLGYLAGDQSAGAVVYVDLRTCPAGSTPSERMALIEQLAIGARHEDADPDDLAAQDRAEETESRWCLQQTIVRLRHRIVDADRRRPEIEPRPGWEDRSVERAKRDGVI